MNEGYASEMIKLLFEMFAFLTFLALLFIGFNIQKIDSFKQDVNYSIERTGGFDSNSLSNLKRDSHDNYNNYFTVDKVWYDANNDGKVNTDANEGYHSGGTDWIPALPTTQYGTPYEYEIHVKIPIPFMSFTNSSDTSNPIPNNFEVNVRGIAVSKVRTDNDR